MPPPNQMDDLMTQIRLTTRRRYLSALITAVAAGMMLGFARNDAVVAAGALTLANALLLAAYAYSHGTAAARRHRLAARPSSGFVNVIALLGATAVLLLAAGLLLR
ncbi:hypothetical protein Sme01_58250 [Sphaerisporangium melleum]|uniref:Uncharacterized protein n=1 Tax=Sphaerisporangium melleum TaxID=321316 RepID=A0A917R7B9_9ACTN|nr:hypothetical protein [Sphaerisporangium melleum]GGK94041.1 hypothetical protein GCM10007964_40530 [Sphaerisporangium melleum]GII73349.1 hypothetical protein Sme01_58250 [Sphaerisporangium melleum]